MFAKATGGDPSQLDAQGRGRVPCGLEPLVTAGKLGALLAQFPASFKQRT